MNALMIFDICYYPQIAKFSYFAKVTTYSKSLDHVLQSYIICSYPESLKFFSDSHSGAISRKLVIKSQNRNILGYRNRILISFPTIYILPMLL